MSRDPRLTWRALSQPDLSAASAAVARAAAAFQAGMEGARSSLETADEARRRRNSAEVAAELMGLDSPDAINQWLENGGLNGRDIDPAIMQAMMGMQGDMLDRDLTRARIDATSASTGLARDRFNLDVEDRERARTGEDAYAEYADLIAGGSAAPAAAPAPAEADIAAAVTAPVPESFRLGVPMELPENRLRWGNI
jgi:hypothetical protein